MFLDILFIYQQFIDDLPPTLSEFITKVRFLKGSVTFYSFKSCSQWYTTPKPFQRLLDCLITHSCIRWQRLWLLKRDSKTILNSNLTLAMAFPSTWTNKCFTRQAMIHTWQGLYLQACVNIWRQISFWQPQKLAKKTLWKKDHSRWETIRLLLCSSSTLSKWASMEPRLCLATTKGDLFRLFKTSQIIL